MYGVHLSCLPCVWLYGSNEPSAIASHLSAFAFIYKFFGSEDPADSFLVKQCFKHFKGVVKTVGRAVDSRLPIIIDILKSMIRAIPLVFLYNHNSCQ